MIFPCMIRKFGLLMFRPTDWKRFCTVCCCARWPLIRYLDVPPRTICRVTLMVEYSSKPMGDLFLSLLSKTIVTLAFVTPAWPRL